MENCRHENYRIIRRNTYHEFLCISCHKDTYFLGKYESSSQCEHRQVLLFHTRQEPEVMTKAKCSECNSDVRPMWKIIENKPGSETCLHHRVMVKKCLWGSGYGHKFTCEACKSILAIEILSSSSKSFAEKFRNHPDSHP